MAKKKPAKKTTKKTTRSTPSKKSAGGKSPQPTAKKTTKKTTIAKTTKTTKTTKKPAAKKVIKKKVTKKIVKKVAKKTSAKVSKKVVKKSTQKVVKKPISQSKSTKKVPAKVVKKTATKKVVKKPTGSKTTKSSGAKPTAGKSSTPAPAAKGGKVAAGASTKPGENTNRPKPTRRRHASRVKKPLILPDRPLLLGPNGPSLKPLIASGSKVKQKKSVLDNVTSRRTKTPLTKVQLENYRHLLLVKRAELMGDVHHLENEAMRGDSGSTGSTQNLEELGSENYEQSLNMNLAASDRERIIEIDDALKRIVDRTYGLCELTYEPIKKARLDELPWARYTIHAARELDSRGGFR
ncbi:MAG: TraR/DksA family transcriptional regulator [Phycisphaerales bacterium]|nr:TraR/DksA family transcriptional regulator [Phycisphaerales bacterium]